MKLSNFVMIYTSGKEPLYLAEVDVTTGALWWKRTERKTIFKPKFSLYWSFLDSGEFTPDQQAEFLEKAYQAKQALLASTLFRSPSCSHYPQSTKQ